MSVIGVAGSLNVDLTVKVPRFHEPRETLTGWDFSTFTGGKGGNQAVAAAKLGSQVCLVGRLGADAYGDLYADALREHGIQIDGVERTEQAPTGVALIEVDATGENRIIVVPGANACVDIGQIDRWMPALIACGIVLAQLEIPFESMRYLLTRLREAGKRVILDPAPAVPLPDEMLSAPDYLTPNLMELSILTGMPVETEAEIERAARRLLARGARTVIVKMGPRGAMIAEDGGCRVMPPFRVRAIDTTAAGDSFNAGLGFALTGGMELNDAVRFANAVGALSTTALGAQGAMPALPEVRALIGKGA